MSWLDDLIDFSASQLGEREVEELMRRGVTPEQAQLYRIGHLNEVLPDWAPGIFTYWAKDRLDDVYVLPLTTTLGEVRGLQLRHIDRAKPGYQDFFLDQREACFFGLGQAAAEMWRTESVYLVEGAFDLFPIQRAYPAVVATLTAYVNPLMVRTLKRMVKTVWIGYDNDKPGRKGVNDFKSHHGNEFQVYVVDYPQIQGRRVKDPADLWEAWGDQQLIPYIRSAMQQQLIEL
jgi:DNA primase